MKIGAAIEKVVKQYGAEDFTPLYTHRGIFCFDYWLQKPSSVDAVAASRRKGMSRGEPAAPQQPPERAAEPAAAADKEQARSYPSKRDRSITRLRRLKVRRLMVS